MTQQNQDIPEPYFRLPANPILRGLLLLLVFVLGIASMSAISAILAGPLGLGKAEDFFAYRWFGWSRSDLARNSLIVFLLALPCIALLALDARRYRKVLGLLGNLSLTAITLTITLFIMEIGFRAVNGLPFWPIENHIAKDRALLRTQTANQYHENLGWVLKPGISSNPDDPETSFTTGEHGVRMNSGEIKPVPTGAILAVGDSFTAGSEVGDRHSWPAQLERLLQEPVVNAGVGGWAADQIVLRAEELAPVLKPHTIVVSFLADDILRSGYRVYGSANKPWFDIDSNGELVRHNNPVPVFSGKPSETGFSLFGYFHLVTFVMDRVGLGTWLRRGDENVENGNDPVAVSCKLLERAHKTFSSQDIRMIFLLQHGGDDRHDRTSQKPHADKVIACAREAGIETIDTWPPLLEEYQKGFPSYKKLFVMHDNDRLYGHMSSMGNALIAGLVADKLKQ